MTDGPAADDGEDDGGGGDPAEQVERLLQFLYQCPVGLVELSEDGTVRLVNPAAVNLLQPALGAGDDLQDVFTVMRRVAPQVVDAVEQRPARRGRLLPTQRVVVPVGPADRTWMEVVTVRVDHGTVMLALLDVTQERRAAQREHELAVRLQKAMLGRSDTPAGLGMSVAYRTAEVELMVGGDWYDVVDLPDGRLGLAVGDVVGHSMDATVTMGQLRSALRFTAPLAGGPADVVGRLDAVAAQVDGGECTTVFYAVLDPGDGTLQYCGAGHPPPLVVSAAGATRFLEGSTGVPLQCGAGWTYASADDRLDPGDRLVLYTDGLVERRDESLSAGLERLRAAAHGVLADPLGAADRLVDRVLHGSSAEDDVCVVVLTYDGPAAGP